jgi:hypothetical protein
VEYYYSAIFLQNKVGFDFKTKAGKEWQTLKENRSMAILLEQDKLFTNASEIKSPFTKPLTIR